MSEASIFMADRRQYATDTFHVFDRVVLVGEELHDGTRSEFYQVYLSQWQLTNLNQGYFLPLDFNAYLQLKRDIAKALFGHLSVWFYASRGQSIEKSYSDLCQLLNIRAYPHVSKATAVLEPSLTELTAIGYLADWDLTRASRGAEFKLTLSPGKRLLSLPSFSSVVNPEARAALEAKLPRWVGELIQKGVAERKARQLAIDVPEEQAVMDQIEYADYLIQQDRKGKSKISNPAGFYIWAIEQNLAVPVDFVTSSKRRLRQGVEHAENQEHFRMMQLENDYEDFCQGEIQKRIESEYPADRLETALREHIKAIKREQPEWFPKVAEGTRREVALGRLRSAIRSHLPLPTFDQWSKSTAQSKLF